MQNNTKLTPLILNTAVRRVTFGSDADEGFGGSDGNDSLYGGGGNDLITGGAGSTEGDDFIGWTSGDGTRKRWRTRAANDACLQEAERRAA